MPLVISETGRVLDSGLEIRKGLNYVRPVNMDECAPFVTGKSMSTAGSLKGLPEGVIRQLADVLDEVAEIADDANTRAMTPGLQGDTGIAGSTGPKGDTGSVGATGAAGAQGVKGDTGSTGSTGSNGTNGSVGATGPAGPTGATGLTGAAGPSALSATITKTIALALGGTTSFTITVTGAAIGMVAVVNPRDNGTLLGSLSSWRAAITGANTVTVYLTAGLLIASGSQIFDIRVIQ